MAIKWLYVFVTFRVSRRLHKMYIGHARVCLSVCAFLHFHTTAQTRM